MDRHLRSAADATERSAVAAPMHRRAACALLVSMVLVTACGVEDRSPSSTTEVERTASTDVVDPDNSAVEAITGYGDFAGTESWDLDWYEVTRLMVECANDNGMPVRLIPPGDGWSMSEIPPDQHLAASAVMEACREGLNLPTPRPPTEEQLEAHFHELLELKACLEDEGYAIEDPPSLDLFVDSWDMGPWHPYESIPDSIDLSEWDRLNVECPQP